MHHLSSSFKSPLFSYLFSFSVKLFYPPLPLSGDFGPDDYDVGFFSIILSII